MTTTNNTPATQALNLETIEDIIHFCEINGQYIRKLYYNESLYTVIYSTMGATCEMVSFGTFTEAREFISNIDSDAIIWSLNCPSGIITTKDGNSYIQITDGEIVTTITINQMATTTQFQPVILGNFALAYSTREDEPYFIVTNADGYYNTDIFFGSVQAYSIYETICHYFISEIKVVENITDPEIALNHVRQIINLPDFDTVIPQAFHKLEEDDRNYCYLLCYAFALNKVYA